MMEANLDPFRLEVIRNAFVAAAEEMSVTIWRTSRSTVVREILDFSTAVFDADGQNLAQSARIPVHLNSMAGCLEALVADVFPLDQWGECDLIVLNDPYSGGQHLPDILPFRAVFDGGVRIGVVGTLCHHSDVGGGAAGSYYAEASELFQEGIRIPPLKIRTDDVIADPVIQMVLANVREPEKFEGDFLAQVSALEIGAQALQRIHRKYGSAHFAEACERILSQSEDRMRSAIADLPEGEVRFEDFVDDDGHSDEAIRISVAIRVHDGRITVDFYGSNGQVVGPVNCTRVMTESAVYYALLSALGPEIPANTGCYRPVEVVTEPGTVVDCRFPAPVAGRMATAHRVVNAVHGALAQLLTDSVPSAYYGTSYVYALATEDSAGRPSVYFEIEVGGGGASAGADGASAYSCGLHNLSNTPVEMIEAEHPVTFVEYGLRPNSGGAGRYRGGLGLVRAWRLDAAAGTFSANLERFRFAPYGLAGGADGAVGRLSLVRGGATEQLPSKLGNSRLRKGDIVRLETSGGGGYGPPEQRAPEAVNKDVADAYVSTELA